MFPSKATLKREISDLKFDVQMLTNDLNHYKKIAEDRLTHIRELENEIRQSNEKEIKEKGSYHIQPYIKCGQLRFGLITHTSEGSNATIGNFTTRAEAEQVMKELVKGTVGYDAKGKEVKNVKKARTTKR